MGENRCEPDPISSLAFFHDRLCSIDITWFAAVPCVDSTRAHPADVRRKEHDVCCRSSTWTLLDSSCSLSGPYVDERGGRANVECAEQEFVLLRRMDPQQHQS